MPEEFKLRDHRRWSEWFLIHSIVEMEEKDIKIPPCQDGKGLEVTLIINGVECSVAQTLDYLGTLHDELVKKEAHKLVKEKLDEEMSAIYDMVADFKRALRQKLIDAGIQDESEE